MSSCFRLVSARVPKIAAPSAWTPSMLLAVTQKILSDVVERLGVAKKFVGRARERQAPRDGREIVASDGQMPVDPGVGFALVEPRRRVQAARDGAALAQIGRAHV